MGFISDIRQAAAADVRLIAVTEERFRAKTRVSIGPR